MVGCCPVEECHIVMEMTAGHKEIEVSVIIKIHHAVAPGHIGIASVSGSGRACHILKQSVACVLVQRGQITLI